ncbi:IS5 family transposase [Chitinophaga sancti]|uniref:IS5 family transposase n=1 Tax=Chitinophaga sancti TaxID=1004 RepID=UPI002A7601DC|nr:IS5 family transposase [Chitinophaga sancti]WPQ60842.1 IS5 family transposase [Chitinophaga sancti]WPQ60971.1 IS5 family transposase [Chitinophaga sancti]WPQ61251.1 IS5 family transposase [Chitinophaga sancti]WPQ61689.1 IS5 family transposase [Chitinophaga sancti]WPQ63661.1 IS5 family transposase [Chitinophaga sancti]
MIRYTPAKQLTLEGFSTPFSQQLSTSNRWVILAAKIPWDKLADVYYKKMRADFGAPTLSARMVIGAVIIKHILNIDDREVVEQITENIYLQYFVGLSSFQQEAPFDASLMVSIRKRLGVEVMSRLNEIILQEAGLTKAKEEKTSDAGSKDESDGDGGESNKVGCQADAEIVKETPSEGLSGTLMLDATVSEQQIDYPTDIKLLNEGRRQLEGIIERGCLAAELIMPRMYRNIARKQYLNIAKKKNKSKRDIRRGIRQQLQYVKRDLKYINWLIETGPTFKETLKPKEWTLIQVIQEMYRQQVEMYKKREQKISDRIVSIYQPHVRPMPRGKDRVSTEFGSKQLVLLKDGYTHIEKLSWDNYNEGGLLIECLETHKRLFGCYPERVLGDQLFGTRENRRYMKEKGIRYVGKPLGRPSSDSKQQKRLLQKQMPERNAIEGKFGQGKNAYGLGKIKARLKDTAESWVMSIYFVMNLLKLAAGSFLSLLQIYYWLVTEGYLTIMVSCPDAQLRPRYMRRMEW